MSIAVVIPYYQRTAGLLTRALRSVLAQAGAPVARIVVVDDTSPVDAAGEVAALGDVTVPITVVRQANAGPAAARNRGLDTLDASIRRVAFLDSDDEWEPEHLARATIALDAGHDFYFADLYQPGQTVSAFRRAGRIDGERHPPIAGADALHAYAGDMFDQIVRGNVIGTSTVVYDFGRFPTQRFDEAFYSAGEDYLFWIALADAGARFCFSDRVEVRYGYGVNVYAGSGWGTDGYLRRVHNEMRYRKRLLDHRLDAGQRTFVRGKVAELRREFGLGLLHRVVERRPLDRGLLTAQLKLDPLTLLVAPIAAGSSVADRLRGRSGGAS